MGWFWIDSIVVRAESDHVAHMVEQWQTESPDVPVGPMQVVARIMRTGQHLEREVARYLSAYELGSREYDVLSALRRSGPPYALTASELGHAILFSSGSLTNLLERLEHAGLITRSKDPDDRRVVRVALSQAGCKLQEEAMTVALRQEERMIASISESERQTLARLLQSLLTDIELTDTRWPLRPRRILEERSKSAERPSRESSRTIPQRSPQGRRATKP